MPLAGRYLWEIFLRLHRRRGSNGFGMNPLSWGEIDAFVRNSGVPLAPWEVEAVETIDDAFMAQQAKASADKPPPKMPNQDA